ncbi:MAG TPA: RIP metalloprotease RseP [Nannocystis sp.]
MEAAELPAGAEALANVPTGVRIASFGGKAIEDWGDLRMAVLTASPGPATVTFDGAPPVTIEVPANDTAKALLAAHLGPFYPPVIAGVLEGQPAAEAGLQAGDSVISAGGKPVRDWGDFLSIVQAHPDQPLDLEVVRGGEQMTVRVVPAVRTVNGPDGEQAIGVIGALPMVEHERPGVLGAVGHGFARTGEVIALIVGFLVDLLTGNASPRSLGGPILIGQLSGQVARLGLQPFLDFMALFSVNLAVLNLLPIPVLDGGHLVFLAIEAIRGRALSFEQRMRLTQVGFVIVLAIMVWALASDFLRLFGL